MTKYSQYLRKLNDECPEEYKNTFVKYKLLKKLLKAIHPEEPDCEVCEARFYEELQRELQSATNQFELKATEIVAAHRQMQQPALCGCLSLGNSQRKRAELAQRAFWCRKYAKANAVALRKILKKHDKVCRSASGKLFLQECWRSEGLFLHSPLLDQLGAIQVALQVEMPPEDPALVERSPIVRMSRRMLRALAGQHRAATKQPPQQQGQQQQAGQQGQPATAKPAQHPAGRGQAASVSAAAAGGDAGAGGDAAVEDPRQSIGQQALGRLADVSLDGHSDDGHDSGAEDSEPGSPGSLSPTASPRGSLQRAQRQQGADTAPPALPKPAVA